MEEGLVLSLSFVVVEKGENCSPFVTVLFFCVSVVLLNLVLCIRICGGVSRCSNVLFVLICVVVVSDVLVLLSFVVEVEK